MAKKIEILENTLLKLLVRRGTDTDRRNITLTEGELGYTTDTERLFIGNGEPGGVVAGNKFLGCDSDPYTTYSTALTGDLAFDTNTKSLCAFKGGGVWERVSSLTESTGDINVSVDAGDVLVNALGRNLSIDANGRVQTDTEVLFNKIDTAGWNYLNIPRNIRFYDDVSSQAFTFPTNALGGKYLRTDASGNLTWEDPVGAAEFFYNSENGPIPVGAVLPFTAGGVIPTGYIVCNGQEVSQTTYSDLFNVIGLNYGSTNPGSTFKVPDYSLSTLYGVDTDPHNAQVYKVGADVNIGSAFGTEWQFMGAQRVAGTFNSTSGTFGTAGTTYTNDTGYYLVINGQVGKFTQDFVRCDVIIGDVDYNIPFFDNNEVNFLASTNSGGGVAGNGTIIIPPGEKYTFFTEGSPTNFDIWELRGPTSGSGSVQGNSAILNAGFVQGSRPVAGVDVPVGDIALNTGYQIIDLNDVNSFKAGLSNDPVIVNKTGVFSNSNNISVQVSYAKHGDASTGGAIDQAICGIYQDNVNGDYTKIIVECSNSPKDSSGKLDAYFNINAVQYTVGTSTSTQSPLSAQGTIYVIKAIPDIVANPTITVVSPLTATVDGVNKTNTAFSPLVGDIEIGIGQTNTITLDDVQMFNFRSKVGVSKGYMESGDILAAYRGSLPVSFDSDVKFVKLEYTSSLDFLDDSNGYPAEDSTNGIIFIDWENRKIKQSSLRKEGDAGHTQHWYESTGAESDGIIMFNTPDPVPSNSAEGIIINWSTRTITGLPAYNRTYSLGGPNSDAVLPSHQHQYIFRDLTNSGSFGSGGGATTVDLLKREFLDSPVLIRETVNGQDFNGTTDLNTLAGVTVPSWATRGIFLGRSSQSNINTAGNQLLVNNQLYLASFTGGGDGNDNNSVEFTEKLTGSSIDYQIIDNGSDGAVRLFLVGFEGYESTAIAGGSSGGSSLLKYGTIDVGNSGSINGGSIPTTGDFTTIDLGNDGANFYDIFECTFNSSLPNSNYNVVFELISNGSVNADNNMRYPIITAKTAAGFTFSIEEGTTATQDLEINVRIESNEVGAGISADKEYVRITGTAIGATAINQTANGTYTYQVNDLQGTGVNTSKIRGLYIRCKGRVADGDAILTATLPDDITLLRPFFQTSESNTLNGHDFVELIKFLPINKNQTSFKLEIDTVAASGIEYDIIGAEQITTAVGGGGEALLEENGYQILPSGMIMQWGKVSHNSVGNSVIFPIPFPNDCLNVTGELIGTDVQANLGITSISKTGFSMNPLIGSTSYWHAIGW